MRGLVVPFRQRIYEMTSPSLTPTPPRGTLGQANTSGPTYFDANGKPINSIQCGQAFTFDVPGSGLNQVWLTIYKDGQKTYDALFSIPMPSFVTACESDIGHYQVIAYDPKSGISLGQTTMVISAASGAVPASSWLSNLSTGAKLALAGGAFFLIRKKLK